MTLTSHASRFIVIISITVLVLVIIVAVLVIITFRFCFPAQLVGAFCSRWRMPSMCSYKSNNIRI